MNPYNPMVTPMLTDLYQITMAYGYWKNGIQDLEVVFDVFFRKNPFGGEFTVFAGLEDILRFISEFRFTDEDIAYLRTGALHNAEPEFFEWLKNLDCSCLRITSLAEGTLTFPKMPLVRIEGPLALSQLLETTILNLVNYASLVATNAARYRLAVGSNKILMEFGLRRAQGPDGAFSASRYCYLGGFNSTSNVLAGKLLGIPISGTHAHSFISAFPNLESLESPYITTPDGEKHNLLESALKIRTEMGWTNTHLGELAGFIAYACSFPDNFLGLIDTYDALNSGVLNYLCVAISLADLGYKPIGIRIDSGDLAYQSKEIRKIFQETIKKYNKNFHLQIVASNDINEETLLSLEQQGNEIDAFGIGTHLVTCQRQPALGAVYKLVEINHKDKMKEKNKTALPGKKKAYRLIGKSGCPLLDILLNENEEEPKIGARILCRHPFSNSHKVYVIPSEIVSLHSVVWDGKQTIELPTLSESREFVLHQLQTFRPDHLRPLNPTPYKMSVSEFLYNLIHDISIDEQPIVELS
ncbi:MAG TPA: nicotinate phosphoribosyltransferase [Planctomycetota bacterium]|nr:nicotinate phosphoribosyltransferase [Planctomycetota bacterium]HQA99591.1 nicotinate phosphoribosyltransferase [Planctomycetota bacterium]